MFSVCRIISKPVSSCVYQNRNNWLLNASKKTILYPLVEYYSDKCGSDKKDSDSSGSKGREPCLPYGPWCCSTCPSDNNPSSPSMYDRRKYGHSLPANNVNVCFDPLPHIPTGIFRNTDCEVLGLGAGKCCFYKNPEYFSFHHMTYYDMHLHLRSYRKPSPNTKRKP